MLQILQTAVRQRTTTTTPTPTTPTPTTRPSRKPVARAAMPQSPPKLGWLPRFRGLVVPRDLLLSTPPRRRTHHRRHGQRSPLLRETAVRQIVGGTCRDTIQIKMKITNGNVPSILPNAPFCRACNQKPFRDPSSRGTQPFPFIITTCQQQRLSPLLVVAAIVTRGLGLART